MKSVLFPSLFAERGGTKGSRVYLLFYDSIVGRTIEGEKGSKLKKDLQIYCYHNICLK